MDLSYQVASSYIHYLGYGKRFGKNNKLIKKIKNNLGGKNNMLTKKLGNIIMEQIL